ERRISHFCLTEAGFLIDYKSCRLRSGGSRRPRPVTPSLRWNCWQAWANAMRDQMRVRGKLYGASALLAVLALCGRAHSEEVNPAVDRFEAAIQPILIDYCYRCHADGMKKGGLAFDQSAPNDLVGKREVWSAVLKNVRAGLMPPPGKPRPTEAEL